VPSRWVDGRMWCHPAGLTVEGPKGCLLLVEFPATSARRAGDPKVSRILMPLHIHNSQYYTARPTWTKDGWSHCCHQQIQAHHGPSWIVRPPMHDMFKYMGLHRTYSEVPRLVIIFPDQCLSLVQ